MSEGADQADLSLVTTDPLEDIADLGLYSGSMPDRHLMVDIETLDVLPGAAILQIAAVTFDPREGRFPVEEFSITIDEISNRVHGRSVSSSTMEWWEQQSQEARDAVFKGPHTELPKALKQFTQWVNELRPTCTRVWAKDPDFDIVILQDACRRLGVMWPFRFWEARSCRTAMEMAYPLGDFPPVKVDGPEHDAIVDCKKQILEIQHSYFVLGC